LRLGEAEIEVGIQMKYLGLILDSHWTFEAHLERLAPSVEATANALGRLLPRLDEPGVGVRRLYAGVVRAKLLYGAPIWARELMDKRRSLQLVRRLHRTVAIRIVRGFRTISAAAAAVLAGFPPPFELLALRYREIYLRTRWWPCGRRRQNRSETGPARRMPLPTRYEEGAPVLRVVEAVFPHWGDWLDGGGPPLTYRVTQARLLR
jgi:hypothetical protein